MKTITFDENAWQLVPKEPTTAMLATSYGHRTAGVEWTTASLWRAILASAPPAPKEEPPPIQLSNLDKLKCRLCGEEPVGIYWIEKGCVCASDPLQALCSQHASKCEPLSDMYQIAYRASAPPAPLVCGQAVADEIRQRALEGMAYHAPPAERRTRLPAAARSSPMSDLKSAAQRVVDMLEVVERDDGISKLVWQDGNASVCLAVSQTNFQDAALNQIAVALTSLREALGDGDE